MPETVHSWLTTTCIKLQYKVQLVLFRALKPKGMFGPHISRGSCVHVSYLRSNASIILSNKLKPNTHRRLNCRVEMSQRRCVWNSQLVGDSLDESEQICQQRSLVASCRRCKHSRRQSWPSLQFPALLSH